MKVYVQVALFIVVALLADSCSNTAHKLRVVDWKCEPEAQNPFCGGGVQNITEQEVFEVSAKADFYSADGNLLQQGVRVNFLGGQLGIPLRAKGSSGGADTASFTVTYPRPVASETQVTPPPFSKCVIKFSYKGGEEIFVNGQPSDSGK